MVGVAVMMSAACGRDPERASAQTPLQQPSTNGQAAAPGAPAGFRAAYEAGGCRWPTPERLRLYQLYHLLNHVLLFGGGYATQALRVARALS